MLTQSNSLMRSVRPIVVDRRMKWLQVLCLSLVVAPGLVGTVRVVRQGWAPRGDFAMTQLRVLDVGTGRTPLLGMPTTVDDAAAAPIHHPGPLQFWLLAAPFRLASVVTDSPASLVVASAVVSTVILGTSGWLVMRSIERPLHGLAVATFASAAILLAGSFVTSSPWNPDLAFVAMLAATSVAAIAMTTRPRMASVLAVVGLSSAAAQAHLSYAAPAFLLASCVLVRAFIETPRDRRRSSFTVIAVTGAVVWIGPILDVVANGGGNARRAVTNESPPGSGWPTAIARLANSVTPWELGLIRPADGMHFARPASMSTYLWTVLLVAVVIWCVRNSTTLGRVSILAGAMLAGLVVSTALAPPTLATAYAAHVQRAWIVPTLLLWSVPVVAGAQLVWHMQPRKALAVVGAVPLVLSAFAIAVDRDISKNVQPICSRAVTDMADAISERVGDQITHYDSRAVGAGTFGFGSQVTSGVYAELERRHGGAVFVGHVATGMMSADRVAGDPSLVEAPPASTVVVSEGQSSLVEQYAFVGNVRGGEDCDDTTVTRSIEFWSGRSTE